MPEFEEDKIASVRRIPGNARGSLDPERKYFRGCVNAGDLRVVLKVLGAEQFDTLVIWEFEFPRLFLCEKLVNSTDGILLLNLNVAQGFLDAKNGHTKKLDRRFVGHAKSIAERSADVVEFDQFSRFWSAVFICEIILEMGSFQH